VHDGYRDRLDAIGQTWRIWGRLGEDLTEQQWRIPTRCSGWDVAAVYAHGSLPPLHLDVAMPSADAPGEPVSAPQILRGFNDPGGVAHTMAETVADRAVVEAAATGRRELVDRFVVHGPRALARLRRLAPTQVVTWPGPGSVTTVAEAMRIVLLEAVVHLLDAQRALGRAPHVPAVALAETARLLAETAPAVELIEAATGRGDRSPLPVLR